MAGCRDQGSTCQCTNPQNVNDGTLPRTEGSPAGTLGLCTNTGPDTSWPWGFKEAIKWQVGKVLPQSLGGDPNILRNYKDGWVRAHRQAIKSLSAQYGLPPVLLAGVAWAELGGKPYDGKIIVYDVRKFDHSWDSLLESLTMTKKPELTSMGPVAIQLRRAAETMGFEFDSLNEKDKQRLVECLQNSDNNLAISAKHLWQLKQIDFPNQTSLGAYEIRVIGTRYNRGPDLTLPLILRNTSYGDSIVRKSGWLQKLLDDE